MPGYKYSPSVPDNYLFCELRAHDNDTCLTGQQNRIHPHVLQNSSLATFFTAPSGYKIILIDAKKERYFNKNYNIFI